MPDGKPNLSLADFIRPRNEEPPCTDYLGAFAVTAGLGADSLVADYEAANDDYSAILVKALADRLAEAFAAYLHARARRESGIAETLTAEQIVTEAHRGIRPGFGYPACPDHSEKFKLFDLLDATRVGLSLTEHAAMFPAASVSGLYFAHPQARYFTVGRLGADQIADYARRKGMPIEEVEGWLSANLSYEPARA
jgi:5-methyltetrahydrofolate--homocysteine methyltransferase